MEGKNFSRELFLDIVGYRVDSESYSRTIATRNSVFRL